MYFENEAQRFREVLEENKDDSVVGFIHDRSDPDALGWVALTSRLLRERFDKTFSAYYSKKVAFLMNRNIVKNFMPAGVLTRVEQNEDQLATSLAKTGLILVGDCSTPEIITSLCRYLKTDDASQKKILFMDHHARGEHDLEDYANAIPMRIESAQSTTSLMLHIMRNLGVELDANDESQLRAAVVARIGIEIDLIGYDADKIAPSVTESLAYLTEVIGEPGEALIRKLRQLRIARAWYAPLARALAQVPYYNPSLAVCGLGVIDDNGILPYVANELMSTGHFDSVVVFAIVYDQLGQAMTDIDLEASGRSRANPEIALPDLFSKVFFLIDDQGRKIARGGGRTNEVLGDFAGAGASVPLKYWLDMKSFGVDKLKRLLVDHAWPIEIQRVRSLLVANCDIKAEHVIDATQRVGEGPPAPPAK